MIRRPPRSTLFPYTDALPISNTRSNPDSRISRPLAAQLSAQPPTRQSRSEEHTSELQSRLHLVCRLLLEKKKKIIIDFDNTLELQLHNHHLHQHPVASALSLY